MNSFRDHAVALTDDFDTKNFPERFSNEIYVSKLSKIFSHKYVSPFSIKYVHQGCELYDLGRGTIQLKKNQGLIINEGQDVTSSILHEVPPPAPNLGMSIFLDPSMMTDVLSSAVANDIPAYAQPLIAQTPHFFDRKITDDSFLVFLRHMYRSQRYDKVLDSSDYYRICEQLLHSQFNFLERVGRLDKARHSTRMEIYQRISVARDFIESSFATKFDLDTVARECAMSKYFLIRSFKSVFRSTPQQFHQAVRVRRAKELLRKGHAITEVSGQLGYVALSSFSRDFKRITNMSPLRFQKTFLSR